jgi:hypothetical protein
MKKSLALVAVIVFAEVPVTLAAQEGDPAGQTSVAQQSSQPGSRSSGQGIRHDAAQAKQGIKSTGREIKQGVKNGARQIKYGIKNGAAQAKRKLAVAQCNDGQYSYTQYRTCNHHGGVSQRFR